MDRAGLVENIPCNVCGGSDLEVVYPARYDEAPRVALNDTFRSSTDEALFDQLVSCRSCGLYYVNPRLRPDVILSGYASGSDELFVSQAAAREGTFRRCLDFIERETGLRRAQGR